MAWSILGDSISTYYDAVPEGYPVFYTRENAMYNGLTGVHDLWWHRVLTAMGAQVLVDAAFSGGHVSGEQYPAANSYERIAALRTETTVPDGILVYLGHNDYGFADPLESGAAEPDVRYFYDAYRVMLRRLRETYPHAQIVCGTLMATYIEFRPDWNFAERNKAGVPFAAFNDAIRRACREEGVTLADIDATGIRTEVLDGSHSTRRGHIQLADAWEQCLGL